MTQIRWFIWIALAWCSAAPAMAQIGTLLYRQAPNRLFGFSADTLFTDDSGHPNGELIADRFSLSQSASVCDVRFWGFYGSSLAQEDEPPPVSETMRTRFFSDDGGLPGKVLHESVVPNPSREPTGILIPTGSIPPEFVYEAQLPDCFLAQAGTVYWLELVQLGDLASRFRWENSSGGEYAVQFPIGSPWHVTSGSGQMAYELRTPEPASAALLAMGIGFLLRRGKRQHT